MRYRDSYIWTRTEDGKFIQYADRTDIITWIILILVPALLLGLMIPRLDNIIVFVLSLMTVISLLCNSILFGMYIRERVVFDDE